MRKFIVIILKSFCKGKKIIISYKISYIYKKNRIAKEC